MNKLTFALLILLGIALNANSKNNKQLISKKGTKGTALNIYWGDIHNHCNLTYGHGDMRSAFEAAKEQLDFVSVTPHALWPDMPGADDPRLNWVIGYHAGAFERLRKGKYDEYLKMTKEYNKEGKFLTFVGYECHSMKDGDHVAVSYDLNEPLTECTSITDLKQKLKGKKVFLTPHHMGYQEGFRGFNWNSFTEGDQTPFVEILSRHGLAESDQGDYNYLHDMGPRVFEGSALYGLEKGKKFGFIGSTDQHAGYPGSYGDGRMAVLSKSLTRDEIWEAIRNRHVYCTTGEKIKLDFQINNAIMGDVIKATKRNIYIKVEGENYIDYVDIVKNGESIKRISGSLLTQVPTDDVVRAKIKINFGWSREKQPVRWDNLISISEGKINTVSPCFRGLGYTAPQENVKEVEENTKVNRIISKDEKSVKLELYSTKNTNTTTATFQGVVIDVTMPKNALVRIMANGKNFEHTLSSLFEGTKAHFMNGWLSECIQIERACPENNFIVEYSFSDNKPIRETDYYYIRVRQRDGHAAWSTPIWAEK